MSMYSDYMDSMTDKQREEHRTSFWKNIEERRQSIRDKKESKTFSKLDIKEIIDFWERVLEMSPVAKYPQNDFKKPAFLEGMYLDLIVAIGNLTYEFFLQIYSKEKTDEDVYEKIYGFLENK